MTNLSGANLSRAELYGAALRRTNLENANLTGCKVYGISVWDARLEGATQSNLLITRVGERAITVDNLEVAQLIYLLLNNAKIRQVIDTITSKVVLILGRFTPERKVLLDALRQELRKRDYLPVLFDFDKPSSRDITETVRTLAHMARFVIADITDAKSIPQELMAIVPNLPSVPIQPLLLESQQEYGMFEHLRRYSWVLEPVLYRNQEALLTELDRKVIAPAEAKVNEQAQK
jgi:Pentapeptide repeats (8 copies)